MEITQDEEETIENLRDIRPCIAMNQEAAEYLEELTRNCNCQGCLFLKASIAHMVMEEGRGEVTH